MSLPTPRPSESRVEFITRAVRDDAMIEKLDDMTSRVTACSAIYAEAHDKDDVDVRKRMEVAHEFYKMEEAEDYTFVLGPVLVPESIDKQGDIISSDEIEMTAHDYMEDSQRPGLMHQLMLGTRDAQIVESYVLREEITMGDRVIKTGTWMLGMRIYNDKLRKMIRDGKLKGYSIGGHGNITEETAA